VVHSIGAAPSIPSGCTPDLQKIPQQNAEGKNEENEKNAYPREAGATKDEDQAKALEQVVLKAARDVIHWIPHFIHKHFGFPLTCLRIGIGCGEKWG